MTSKRLGGRGIGVSCAVEDEDHTIVKDLVVCDAEELGFCGDRARGGSDEPPPASTVRFTGDYGELAAM